MSGIVLRGYQEEFVDAVMRGLDRGVTRQLAVSPTGSGKTLMFSEVIRRRADKPTLILAHRDELLKQARSKLIDVAPELAMSIGLVKAGANDVGAPVVIASVQTLARQSRREQLPKHFGTVIIDEAHHCHVGGTLVETPDGECAIEDLRRGDQVTAWDGSRFVRRRVLNTWRHRIDGPVHKFTTDSGRQVCVTPNHKLYSEGERIYARDIGVGTDLSVRPLRLDDHEDAGDSDALPLAPQGGGAQTLSGLLDGLAEGGPPGPRGEASQRPGRLRELWRILHQAGDRRSPEHLSAWQRLCRPGDPCGGDGDAQRESGIPGAPVRADARRAEPDGGRRGEGADDRDDPRQGRARRDHSVRSAELRQRRGADADRGGDPRALSGRGAAVRRDDGRRRTSLPLQARCGVAVAEGRSRLGRLLSPDRRAAKGRRPQGSTARLDRVVDSPGAQRGGPLLDDRVVAVEVRHHAGWVYDLEVAEDHNYIANGVLSSNSTADSYQAVLDWLDAELVLGVTATAERADGTSLEEYFDELVFARSLGWMVEQGYLVPPRGKRISVDVDLSKVKKSHGDFQSDALADALEGADAIGDILAAYTEHGEERKTVVFTPNVAMAHHTADAFRDAGHAAEAVDGDTPDIERAAILERFHTGGTKVLVNCALLIEGWDEPSVGCIILAAPTKSKVKFTQIIGRGLRLYPGKQDCVVLDVVGASEDNSIASLPPLFGLDSLLDGESVTEAQGRERREAQEEAERAAGEEEAAIDKAARRRRRNAESIAFFNRDRMHWITIGDRWAIPLDAEHTIVLWPTEGEHFDVLLVDDPKQTFRYLAHGLDLGYATGSAEETVKKHGSRLLGDTKAVWREDPVSQGQRRHLYRLGLGARMPGTKGEANDLIEEAKLAKQLGRIEATLKARVAAEGHDLERVA